MKTILQYDPTHDYKAYPPLNILRKSLFITINSVFEELWKDVIGIYNSYFPPIVRPNINFELINYKGFSNTILLDKVLLKHQILFEYNYIRNKIVHSINIDTSSRGFLITRNSISGGQIKHVQIQTIDGKTTFVIKELEFVQIYIGEIVDFLNDIIETSFNDRNRV